jgi:hypothetical protein
LSDQTQTTGDPFNDTGEDPFANPPNPAPPAPQPQPPADVAEAAAQVATEPQPAAPDPVQAPAPPPPAPEPPAEAEEIPTVNREGEPVAAGPLDTTPEDRGEPEAPAEAPAPPEVPAAPQEAPEQPAAPQAATPPAPAPVEGDAVEPPKDKAEPELRLYKVLYQTGPTTFEVANLDDAPNTVEREHEHVKGKKKKERFIQARNGEGALRIAFIAVGRPAQGVSLLVIPSGSYKVKPVKPANPQPERERLTIG